MTREWVTRAPCRGDSALFSPRDSAWRTQQDLVDLCSGALEVCRWCPFTKECVALVQPRYARFDGVCGGRIWCGGAVVKSLFVEVRTPTDSGRPEEPDVLAGISRAAT
ncbi:WhiB family transcriptional regulator [Streptomyces cinereoruber]|uniref:hypothetical protein n=1 Tax=Streptomyces cinereoruber TaxID=67260 RepID=UPI003636D93B